MIERQFAACFERSIDASLVECSDCVIRLLAVPALAHECSDHVGGVEVPVQSQCEEFSSVAGSVPWPIIQSFSRIRTIAPAPPLGNLWG